MKTIDNCLWKMKQDGSCFLSRDTVKLLAVMAMAASHVARVFLMDGSIPYLSLTAMGNFTAPCMCFFLTEGYEHTSDRKRYLGRLLATACLSQPFYQALFGSGLNMLFTLCACFLALAAADKIKQGWVRTAAIGIIIFVTLWMDWPVLAVAFVLIFHRFPGRKAAFLNTAAYLACSIAIMKTGIPEAMLNGAWVFLAGLAATCLYHKCRVTHKRKSVQYFFYLFYPAHLALLCFFP